MKVGDYVRDSEGEIAKIIRKHEIITEDNIYIDTTYYWKSLKDNCEGCFSENMSGIKSSSNIKDLIEYGDIVKYKIINGEEFIAEVWGQRNDYFVQDCDMPIDLRDLNIVSIVTHEQFSQMEYRIRE